ncbi:hypothetical protein V8B97DRAFT_1991548 [Scleroderma yunnanense]
MSSSSTRIGNLLTTRGCLHIPCRVLLVPEHILTNGLSFNRPCLAQIMLWGANRKTI